MEILSNMPIIQESKQFNKNREKISSRYHIAIPHDIMRICGWKKGTRLAFIATGEKELRIKEMPIPVKPEDK